jgi:hypothetical protein
MAFGGFGGLTVRGQNTASGRYDDLSNKRPMELVSIRPIAAMGQDTPRWHKGCSAPSKQLVRNSLGAQVNRSLRSDRDEVCQPRAIAF